MYQSKTFLVWLVVVLYSKDHCQKAVPIFQCQISIWKSAKPLYSCSEYRSPLQSNTQHSCSIKNPQSTNGFIRTLIGNKVIICTVTYAYMIHVNVILEFLARTLICTRIYASSSIIFIIHPV